MSAPGPVRVVLADDQVLVRAGFSALLASEPDLEVVGEAADGAEAVQVVRRTRPDVVLMDIQMPQLDGLAATARITSDPALASTKVVVLTTFELDEYVFGALRAGASGFLLKDTDPAALLHAVRIVHDGQALLSPQITRRLIEAFVQSDPHTDAHPTGQDPTASDTAEYLGTKSDLEELTVREKEVLTLVGRGMSNRKSQSTSCSPR